MNYRVLALFLTMAACLFAGPAHADEGTPTPLTHRQWKVMGIIPETHLTRPHIPDPAVETAISRACINAGYKVVDQERVAQVRYSEMVDHHSGKVAPNKYWDNHQNKTVDDVARTYVDMVGKLCALKPTGLTGAGSTAIRDIEVETDGLMINDRKVIKIDEAQTRRANETVTQGLTATRAPQTPPPLVVGGRLPTRWDKDVSPTNPLPEYPRPQMARKHWMNLNGPWQYGLTDSTAITPPATFPGHILVPYPYEAALSGIGKASPVNQRLWYRRTFAVPADWRSGAKRVLLHFGAVNWDSSALVNGRLLGRHKGGYDGIDYDITDALKPGANQLVVSAFNPIQVDSADAQVVGKQRRNGGGIFYTGVTGIWQSVWLESVPAVHITGIKVVPDIDAKTVHVTVNTQGNEAVPVTVTATDDGKTVAGTTDTTGTDIILPIGNIHLWTPDDPHLYGLRIVLPDANGGDAVDSYFAMRKISLGYDDQGRTRIFLNNRFVFQVGALDQGYWPDGIYTAPTDDALRFDIEAAKRFGFNLLRKHAKVEPDRWYYWTDKLGMLVWQDMPQCFGAAGADGDSTLTDAAKAQWLAEWKQIIAQRINHPSIVVWTTFNEGWGQHDTAAIVALTKQIDPSRLVNNASGWHDRGVGDIRDAHSYPSPWCDIPSADRASVNGEFGGITMRVPDHTWARNLFGYGATLNSGWKVTQQYQKLLKSAYAMRDERGCSAFVYTQLTDVEQESNGLMTYDREVVKPIEEIIAAADKGKFLPLPPAPVFVSHDPMPTSQDQPQIWSYTTRRPADNWQQPSFDAFAWKRGPAPFGQGYAVNTPWTDTPGDIWMRREVTLPATIPAKLLVLTLHDEDVEVYINGVLAASEAGYFGDYVTLPLTDAGRSALVPGKNTIAVHCRQTFGGQVLDVGIVAAD